MKMITTEQIDEIVLE